MEKCYEVFIDRLESRIVEDVSQVKFNDGNLSFYDDNGDLIAYFKRDSYAFFQLAGAN